MKNKIIQGDCLEKLKALEDNSVDAIVTDPPYGLSFMGKKWDYDVPSQDIWEECLRVLKPGGYLLAFAGTRTQHRMAVRIEDAGFEIRDMIAWVYGSGFPKSHNIGKAVDKLQGNEREDLGRNPAWRKGNGEGATTSTGWAKPQRPNKDKGTSEWEGWGTALKPSNEPLTLAQKPLTSVPLENIIDIQLLITTIICLSLSNAKYVESLLGLSQQELKGESVSAHIIAGLLYGNRQGELSEKMGMFKSLEMERTILSIVELWNSILGKNFSRHNTFTTSTAISLTTELRTLKSLILQTIPENITQEKLQAFGTLLNATFVENNLNEEKEKHTNETFAQEIATKIMELKPVNFVEKDLVPVANIVNTVLTNAIQNLGEKISPNLSPIIMSRKPLSEKTVAENCLKWGTGGINIDGCRVETVDNLNGGAYSKGEYDTNGKVLELGLKRQEGKYQQPQGRFPANLIHDGSDEVVSLFPNTKSGKMGANNTRHTDGSPNGIYGKFDINHPLGETYGDSGSASRFFYCAKASKSERNKGCEELEEKDGIRTNAPRENENVKNPLNKNNHPTVKPIALMEYLVKLVSREGAVVLDPFAGSGSTLLACKNLNRQYIGIEKEPEYCKIAEARINHVK